MYTKGKWEIQWDTEIDWDIVVVGFTIARNCTPDSILKPDESKANAQRIITCVNSHDNLLEVCKLVKYQLKHPDLMDTPRLLSELQRAIKEGE